MDIVLVGLCEDVGTQVWLPENCHDITVMVDWALKTLMICISAYLKVAESFQQFFKKEGEKLGGGEGQDLPKGGTSVNFVLYCSAGSTYSP